jgi:hypothetical protein
LCSENRSIASGSIEVESTESRSIEMPWTIFHLFRISLELWK